VAALIVVSCVLSVKVRDLNARGGDYQSKLSISQSELARTRTELKEARDQSAQLLWELDQAKDAAVQVHTQLDQANSGLAQLRTQLDQSNAGSTQIQSQLDQAKAAAADLQSQLDQAKSGGSQLQSQLDQAKSGSADLQAQLAKAQDEVSRLQPLAARSRPMPITTSITKSHGNSFRLNIKNLYLQPMKIQVTITRAGRAHPQTNLIEAGGSIDLDKLAAGDVVEIAHPDYDTARLTIK
jgi:septal ring factor EnvC (AmiA/AmiB activator)